VILAIPVLFAITLHEYGRSSIPIVLVSVLAFLATFCMPVAIIAILLREGIIRGDLMFRERSNRIFVYPAMIAGLGADWLLFTYGTVFEIGAILSLAGFTVLVGLFV